LLQRQATNVPIQNWGQLYHQVGRCDMMRRPHAPKNEKYKMA
jgi:hypothetical protein